MTTLSPRRTATRVTATLGLSLLLATAVLVVPSGSAAEQPEASLRIEPRIEQNTAVRWHQRVIVSGNAADGPITGARLIGLEQAGTQSVQVIQGHILNRGASGTREYLHNDGGRLTGEVQLDCTFGPPEFGCSNVVRQVMLEVTVGGQVFRSNRLRVDYTPPQIRRYELTKPDEITVVFTEPVYHPRGERFLDPVDWQITDDGRPVVPIAVRQPGGEDCVYEPGEDATAGPSGCTRILQLADVLDEDATPRVRYIPGLDRPLYVDFASNVVLRARGAAISDALDRIRPPLPRIEAVAGNRPDEQGRTAGETRSPGVTVSNLRAGHTVHVKVEGEEVAAEPAAGSTHTVQLPEFGPGEEFRIEAVVTDPAGNRSTDDLHAARADSGPSRVVYCIGTVCPLPHIPVPNVLSPDDELYTSEPAATIAGDLHGEPSAVTVRVRDRDTRQAVASTTAAGDGSWSVQVGLAMDRRHHFEVRAVHGEQASEWVPVDAIIRDRSAPLLQVLQPAPDPTQPLRSGQAQDTRPRHRLGDQVTVSWLAADPAPGDPQVPDHGSHVDIRLLFSDGTSRTVAEGLDYTRVQQSFAYTISAQDVTPAPREAAFEVTVTDLAGNSAISTSHPLVIEGSLVDELLRYVAVFVHNDPNGSVVEARFNVPLQGTTTPADWRVDNLPVRSAQVGAAGTVVRLVTSQPITDPNATPTVQFFTPPPVASLRGQDGRAIHNGQVTAHDGIPPVLSISRPDPGPRSVQSVTVTGQTDRTSRPNAVRAHRDGQVVAQTTAGSDGSFTLVVPLARDRVNRVTVTAVDPATNVSPTRVFEVIEDSTPPVAMITNPAPDSAIPRTLPIRWTTIDNNPGVVDIAFRTGSRAWQTIVAAAPDTGAHTWRIPDSIPDDAMLALRITATDRAGHRGQPSTVAGLTLRAASLLEPCEDPDPAPFTDRDRVPAAHRPNVDCLYALGIAKGTVRGGQLWFLPHDDISRGQFSGFLYRTLGLAGIELPPPASRFDDVPAGHTFDTDIHRLAAARIIRGYDERRFGPSDSIRRDQTASLLLRALGYSRSEEIRARSGGYFADTAGNTHRAAIDAAFEQGLVVGRIAPGDTPGIYDPAGLTTRAHTATALVRHLRQMER